MPGRANGRRPRPTLSVTAGSPSWQQLAVAALHERLLETGRWRDPRPAAFKSTGVFFGMRMRGFGPSATNTPRSSSISRRCEQRAPPQGRQLTVPSSASEFPCSPWKDAAWWVHAINLPAGWQITRGHPEVVIAVVDDGVQIDHEEFVGRIFQPASYYNETGEMVVEDRFETYQVHGTPVAALAAANARQRGRFGWGLPALLADADSGPNPRWLQHLGIISMGHSARHPRA